MTHMVDMMNKANYEKPQMVFPLLSVPSQVSKFLALCTGEFL